MTTTTDESTRPASAPDKRLYRALPSVDILLKNLPDLQSAELNVPRAMLRDLVNSYLDLCRAGIKSGQITRHEELALPGILPGLMDFLRDKARPHFRRVLNATGVVIHTNLGRSRLAEEAVAAVAEASAWYSNLEFNLESGERGSRYSHVEELLCSLTGAEAALVVNNNAAAVLLVLDTLCKGREVIVSRGELVEIGGSFRIPEVMSKSGCVLREVGASNRAHLRDYRDAIGPETAALMKVHTSNYRVIGFHSEVGLDELRELGKEKNLPLIVDLGSGNLCDFAAAGMLELARFAKQPQAAGQAQAAQAAQSSMLSQLSLLARDEPRVQKVVGDGADIVTFSGDKVLGGPQAGIIVGTREYIDRIKKNALNRALRIDKMTLAALEATLRLYTEPELARKRVPTLRMICAAPEELKQKAQTLARKLRAKLGVSIMSASNEQQPDNSKLAGSATLADNSKLAGNPKFAESSGPENAIKISVRAGSSLIGGGSFPERHLATSLVTVESTTISPAALRERLLKSDPPLVARIEDDKLCLDVRTLETAEFELVCAALGSVLGKGLGKGLNSAKQGEQ